MRFFHRDAETAETPRLLLRRWQSGDYLAYLTFASDPEVALPAGSVPARDAREADAAFRQLLRDEDSYAIVLKETGAAIGKIRFQKDAHRGNHAGSLSVGYQLARASWGKGYMTEALRAFIVMAFEERGADVLGVSHFAGNDRSRRVIEKCGFRYEGTLLRAYKRFDGRVFDDVCYSMTREEYRSRKAQGDGGGK